MKEYTQVIGGYQVVNIADILTIFRLSEKHPETYKLELEFIQDHAFRVSSDNLGRWRGEFVQFKDEVDGKMTKLLMDETTFYRVKKQ